MILTGAVAGGYFLAHLPGRPVGETNPDNTLFRELRRGGELHARHRKAVRRHQQVRQVVWNLVHRRLTLIEAAARVRELDRQIELDPAIYRLQTQLAFPADSLQASLCRKVIALVRGEARDRPGWAAVVRRLEGELAALLARGRFVGRETGSAEKVLPPFGPGAKRP
jgi:hypothetical protein